MQNHHIIIIPSIYWHRLKRSNKTQLKFSIHKFRVWNFFIFIFSFFSVALASSKSWQNHKRQQTNIHTFDEAMSRSMRKKKRSAKRWICEIRSKIYSWACLGSVRFLNIWQKRVTSHLFSPVEKAILVFSIVILSVYLWARLPLSCDIPNGMRCKSDSIIRPN